MYTLPAPFELRPVDAHDQGFLEELYFSSRQDMHQAVANATVLRQLIALQRQVQQAGFEQNYPNAQHLIVMHSGSSIGRVVVDSGPTDLRLVDIAIAPSARRIGAANLVLRALQDAAVVLDLPIRLSVARSNQAARNLYLGLGFTVHSQDPVLEQMTWRGGTA